jgi:hypothetical protein
LRSRIELQWAIAFGGTDVRDIRGNNPGLRLQFEEWQEREEGFLLPKVWVRVVGLRKSLRVSKPVGSRLYTGINSSCGYGNNKEK